MGKMSINFENEEQYNNFIQSIKDEVIKDMGTQPHPRIPKNWVNIREQMEDRFRSDNYSYADNCGWWHTQMQALYAAFRLAFQKPSVAELRHVDGERLQNFHDELFELIDKYREGN